MCVKQRSFAHHRQSYQYRIALRFARLCLQDYGWADSGWHRMDDHDPSKDVQTPNMNALVKEGIEMDRHYVYKYCSPTRTAIQSGRNPYHVNPLNAAPEIYNPGDPVSGMAAMPRNMTGMAMKMSAGGYKTHMFGKWDVGMGMHCHRSLWMSAPYVMYVTGRIEPYSARAGPVCG